jgi:acetyl esterase/lipase
MKAFSIPPHPPALPITKTCIYKTIDKITIPIDIYVPTEADVDPPIMLFIHGGGWSGGNRTDYSRPLFYHFLSLGFIVTSMDYRLLPETKLEGQMEDIRDVEGWLRKNLAREVKEHFSGIQDDKIIVVGASAGAHLALLTVSLGSISLRHSC